MSTPLRLQAFSFWENVWNKHSWNIPVTWNTNKLCFEFIKDHNLPLRSVLMKYKVLIFQELLMMSIGAGGSAILFLKQILFPPEISTISLFQFFLLGTSTCVALASGFFSLCALYNRAYLPLIISQIRRIEESLKATSKKTKRTSWYKSDINQKVDIVGLLMCSSIICAPFCPFIVIPFVCIFKSDPLFHRSMLIYPSQTKSRFLFRFLLFLFRTTVEVYVTFGALRTSMLTVLIFAWGIKADMFCSAQIKRNSLVSTNPKNNDPNVFLKSIRKYKEFYMLFEINNKTFINNLATGLLSGGILLEVLSVFIIVRMSELYNIVPAMYICSMIVAIGVPTIAHITVPEAGILNEDTSATIRLWKLQTSLKSYSLQRKYLLKVLREIRPCAFCSGLGDIRFFSVIKSTPTTYYETMINYVISVLMSVPKFDVKYKIA